MAVLAPVAVRVLGHHLTFREVGGITLVLVALLVLLAGRGSVGVHSHFRNAALGIYLSGSVCAGACLLLIRQRRTYMLAAVGGILYGAADVAIKALTGLASHHGVTAALTSPWLIATIAASIGAFFCFQRALQSGKPMPMIALMTAGNDIVSIIGGVVVFADPLGHRPITELAHLRGLRADRNRCLAARAGASGGHGTGQRADRTRLGALTNTAPAISVAGRSSGLAGGRVIVVIPRSRRS